MLYLSNELGFSGNFVFTVYRNLLLEVMDGMFGKFGNFPSYSHGKFPRSNK